MNTILILGGYGYTGRLLAKHLLQQTNYNVVIGGRHLDKAQALAKEMDSKRVTALQVDAADPKSLQAALRGVDLLLVAAPLTSAPPETVIHAVLETGVDYLDVQLGAKKFALLESLAQKIKEKKLCFITEAGFHPGLPAAMVRYAANQMDCIERAVTAGYLNMGAAKLPFTEAVDELMELFKDYQAQVYKNGRWTKAGSFDIRKINFGGEIGLKNCYSMFFEELRGLPEMYPSLKEVGFYISETHWLMDWVINMLVMLGLKIAPQRGVRPLGRLMWWGMQTLGKPPYVVALMVEATGQLNGRQAKVHARIEHEDGYELTAIPVVAFLMQYNKVRHPGLHLMGHLAEPKQLFKAMERMGVKVTTSIQ